MFASSPESRALASDVDAMDQVLWPRRSMIILVLGAAILWAVPIAIGYGLIKLF